MYFLSWERPSRGPRAKKTGLGEFRRPPPHLGWQEEVGAKKYSSKWSAFFFGCFHFTFTSFLCQNQFPPPFHRSLPDVEAVSLSSCSLNEELNHHLQCVFTPTDTNQPISKKRPTKKPPPFFNSKRLERCKDRACKFVEERARRRPPRVTCLTNEPRATGLLLLPSAWAIRHQRDPAAKAPTVASR